MWEKCEGNREMIVRKNQESESIFCALEIEIQLCDSN